MRYLIDTNIIIYHLNGDFVATDFIQGNFKNSTLSFIAYIEVLSYKYTSEEELKIRKFLNAFDIVEINREIIEESIKIRRSRKMKLPDCIIAATALSGDFSLVTKNSSDFNIPDLMLSTPIPHKTFQKILRYYPSSCGVNSTSAVSGRGGRLRLNLWHSRRHLFHLRNPV